jgi:hypothetical protein
MKEVIPMPDPSDPEADLDRIMAVASAALLREMSGVLPRSMTQLEGSPSRAFMVATAAMVAVLLAGVVAFRGPSPDTNSYQSPSAPGTGTIATAVGSSIIPGSAPQIATNSTEPSSPPESTTPGTATSAEAPEFVALDDLDADQRVVFDAIDSYRSAHSLPSLKPERFLMTHAELKTRTMADIGDRRGSPAGDISDNDFKERFTSLSGLALGRDSLELALQEVVTDFYMVSNGTSDELIGIGVLRSNGAVWLTIITAIPNR